MTALLSTTYFGPVQWYQKLYRYDCVLIEQHETFQKQTYRNRCLIATTQGVQALTVPIEHSPLTIDHSNAQSMVNVQCSMFNGQCSMLNGQCSMVNIQSLRLSDHGEWRRQHWQAIQSAYGESPFFEYYEDDLRPFFTERRWELLLDFNDAICRKMCELIDIHPNVEYTTHFTPLLKQGGAGGGYDKQAILSLSGQNLQVGGESDFRDVIRPKHPLPDPDFQPRPYYQVFAQKHGFLSNLSILDLLLNMGPESIFFLR